MIGVKFTFAQTQSKVTLVTGFFLILKLKYLRKIWNLRLFRERLMSQSWGKIFMSFLEEWELNGIFWIYLHKILVRHLLLEWSHQGNHQKVIPTWSIFKQDWEIESPLNYSNLTKEKWQAIKSLADIEALS